MKRLLPLLTLALLGAATTASAAYYYDYYLDPPKSDIVTTKTTDGNVVESDSFTYGTRDNAGIKIDNPNTFSVNRELNWNSSFKWAGANNSFFRIELGEKNTQSVTLYLTDYVSEVVPQAAYLPTHSSSNALFNMDIKEYGYRTLTYDATSETYTAGKTVSYQIFDKDGNLSDRVTEIDSIDYNGDGKEMVRYKYELGTFKPGDIIEVYLKDVNNKEVYSFSSNEEGVYTPFDRTSYETNSELAQGGFGDGGYRVAAIQTDAMLDSYYFVEKLDGPEGEATRPNPEYHSDYPKFNSDIPEENPDHYNSTLAAGKAMPLSQLIPNVYINEGLVTGTAVAFGIYGTVGKPLPGGLPIALVAGLFGLGFCYIRRRKAIAG